jgi:uncharacterized protein YecT (DUF1311 family)
MKTDRIVLGVVLAMLFLPGLSVATSQPQDDQAAAAYGLRPSLGQCLDQAQSATAPMRTCLADELDYQDKRLNKAYHALMAKLNPALQAKLKAEEKTWIQYRDNRCAPVVDGIERPELDGLSCKVDETGKQASDLEARLFVQ